MTYISRERLQNVKYFILFCNSLVRYLHPSDEELKSLIGKNAVSSNKGKVRKGAASDSRFALICLFFWFSQVSSFCVLHGIVNRWMVLYSYLLNFNDFIINGIIDNLLFSEAHQWARILNPWIWAFLIRTMFWDFSAL